MAGDWLAQGPATHGAKGLSQEKAYVTGLQAGNQVLMPAVLVGGTILHVLQVAHGSSCMQV